MKQKEMMIVGGVAIVTAIISFVVSGAIFGNPKNDPIKVPVVTKISSSFPNVKTDENYTTIFNENALNPTQLIQIGGDNNNTPFQNASQ